MSNIHKYACCEGGTYHEDTYSDLDQGQGLLEVGSWVSVDMDLVPDSLLEDDSFIIEYIEMYLKNEISKPNWIV